MPNAAWTSYDLCANSDVIRYINSPEIPLALTATLLVPFGITVVLSSATITSGIPHRLLAGSRVRFSTTITLPAPLLANTDYFVVATPSNVTFTISTVAGGTPIVITNIGSGQQSAQDSTVLLVMDGIRGDAKDIIRDMLLVNLKHRIPEIISACLSYKRRLFNKFVRGIEYDVNQVIESAPLNAAGVMTSEGVILNVLVFLQAYPQIRPRIFVSFGVPAATFESGVALTGDLAIDTSTFNTIYINKSTDINNPNWLAEYTAEDAINNLLNVGTDKTINVLQKAAVYQTTMLMIDNGLMRNRINYEGGELLNYTDYTYKHIEDKFNKAMRRALPLIQVDIDGDGVIHDHERRLMSTALAVMA